MRGFVLALAFGSLIAACKKPAPPPTPEEDLRATAPKPVPKVEPHHRCAPVSADPPFSLGPADTGRAPAIKMPPSGEPVADDTQPFAAEVGEGVAFADGFAVGTIHESEDSHSMSVVTLDHDGRRGKVLPLGTAHGDIEPPRVAARGSIVVAGTLTPSLNGRTLRLAKIEAGNVTWGASIQQRGGESQAFDIGLGEKKGVVVWDEDGPSSTVVQASTFDTATATNATTARSISPAGVDAESPRLAPRAGGGYWLSYIARRPGTPPVDAGYDPDPIGFRSLEVLALDAQGSPTGVARSVTPKDAHVMTYDMIADGDGAIVVWRDNDTPLESASGPVMRTMVRPATIDPPAELTPGESGGGAPSLLPGWLALTDAADMTRLAPLGRGGELAGPLAAEPDIGSGEPIALGSAGLLVARPAGRAVKLFVMSCTRDASPSDAQAP